MHCGMRSNAPEPHLLLLPPPAHCSKLLCALANKLSPDSVKKIETSTSPFKQMGNIASFLRVAKQLRPDGGAAPAAAGAADAAGEASEFRVGDKSSIPSKEDIEAAMGVDGSLWSEGPLAKGLGLMVGAHGLTVGHSLWQSKFTSESSDEEHAAMTTEEGRLTAALEDSGLLALARQRALKVR